MNRQLPDLSEATSHPGHEFWPLDRSTRAGIELMVPRIRGHQQWTDALLLWQAVAHEGVFVTFDSGVKELATGKLTHHFLLLKRGEEPTGRRSASITAARGCTLFFSATSYSPPRGA